MGATGREAQLGRSACDGIAHNGLGRFGNNLTDLADEEDRFVICPRMHAGGKGIQPLDPVRKPMFHQKIERPVRHRRLCAKPVIGQPLKHLIGPQRTVFFEKNFKGAPPHRGQAQPGFGRTCFCRF